MVDYKKEVEKMIQDLKQENPDREVSFKDNYILSINGLELQVSILDIKEPMEKDDEKTNINKMQILFKTKDGYVLIAEVTEDNEIMIDSEGIKKAGLEDKILLTGSDKISLREDEEKQKDIEEQENGDQEKDDEEKPELEPEEEELGKEKEEIARQYNVNSNQVIHIAKDEKVTEDHRFDGFARWAEGYDDIFIIPGEDEYSWKFIGSRDGEREEIENENRQIGGKNPDITIKRMDNEGNITEIRPIAMYETDNETAIAISRDEHGKTEALACRQEGGDEKTYWGSIIPEASGKNVNQSPTEVREVISKDTNSSLDLAKKGNELEYTKDLNERSAPIEVKVDSIDGNHTQIRAEIIEKIAEDLMKRDGILDRATVQPGFYENKAQKVLKLMEENKGMNYEEAIDRVENQNKRDEGGRTPDQKRNREG